MTDGHNPALARWRARQDGNKGGPASIERPDAVANVVWQTRPAEPTEYEHRLADALQRIFAREIYDLPSVIRELNAAGVRAPDGSAWTEETFAAAMRRLGE